MRKIILYLSSICALLTIATACSNDEDTTPSNAEEHLFSPAENDNSETAVLRRNFHKEVGSYLLFNDTLKHAQNGVDVYGNPIWSTELVDISYTMSGSSSSTAYTYALYKDYASQLKAVNLVKEKLISRLGSALPYSFMIVDTITAWKSNHGILEKVKDDSYYGTYTNPTYLLGQRCYAISLYGKNTSAYEDDSYFNDIFVSILMDKFKSSDESVLAKFKSYVSKYAGEYKTDVGYPRKFDNDLARSLGFWEDWSRSYFPSADNDLKFFVTAISTYTTAQVEQQFANYPIVIERFILLKNIAKSWGIKFAD